VSILELIRANSKKSKFHRWTISRLDFYKNFSFGPTVVIR
jgi:hypothetical protein